ncbi:MAG: hypothetical protein M4D85_05175 [Actinomycetota bacterium]|nr:hypothetical protein [Actinomycetota bacterium]
MPDRLPTRDAGTPGAPEPTVGGGSADASWARAPAPPPPQQAAEPMSPPRREPVDRRQKSGGLLALLDGPYTVKRFAAELLIALILLGLGAAVLTFAI